MGRQLLLAWGIGVIATLASLVPAATQTVTIYSPSNGRNTNYYVYTPPGYSTNPTTRYPVVFSLHGIGGTGSQRANVYAPTLDSAINAGDLPPSIWVFPDGQTNSFYGDAFDGHKQVYSNIIHEILPHVDATFRTVPDRNHRVMEGFSMGGFGATMLTARHPELFSAVLEYGGALAKWSDLTNFNHAVAVEMYDDVESNWLPYSLWDQTALNANLLRTTVNYKMIVGDADPQQNSNQRFRDYLLSLNIDPQYQVLPGVAHVASDYLTEGSGLAFIADHFNSIPEPGIASLCCSLCMVVRRRRRAYPRP